MFKYPFSFEGRIRRLEYGISLIIYTAIVTPIRLYVQEGGSKILLLAYIPLLWFIWAQGAKRCHDRGNSGFYQIIPFYGLWLLFGDGDLGENEYGPNPKGIGNMDDEIEQIGNMP